LGAPVPSGAKARNTSNSDKMRKLLSTLAIAATVLGTSTAASAQNEAETIRLGRTMWAAFSCSDYAHSANDMGESVRLLRLGLKTGHEFVRAVRERRISRAAIEREFHQVVLWLLDDLTDGSNDGLIVRKISSAAGLDAYDQVARRGNAIAGEGYPAPVEGKPRWVFEPGAEAVAGVGAFQEANCALIR